MLLKQSATCYKKKAKLFLVTRPVTYRKIDSCFWFLGKDKKGTKVNL